MIISIGGDVAVKNDCEELFEKEDYKTLFNDVIDELNSSDKVIVNLECAVTDSDNAIKKIGPNLKAPVNTVKTLKLAGVTDCALANNHIFDYGKQGLSNTITLLNQYGIGYTGVGENRDAARKNLIFDNGDKTVAIVNVCEHEYSYALKDRVGTRAYDPYDTMDDITEAKKNNDYVIVIYHGGKEGCEYPSERLVKLCRSMVKHGASVVLCQHSHCIGCYEKFGGGHILYGQGNFHFICKEYEDVADGGAKWNTGLLIKLTIGDDVKFEMIPTVVDGKGIRLANQREKADILNSIKERSVALADESYIKKFEEFSKTLEYYKFIPDDLSQLFAHYLDCESHTDVWKVLYKTWNETNEK